MNPNLQEFRDHQVLSDWRENNRYAAPILMCAIYCILHELPRNNWNLPAKNPFQYTL